MDKDKKKQIVDQLLETFRSAGDLALKLRKEGLKETIKEDNTPVTNGDLEVNNIITKKIEQITPEIPIVSEEAIKNKNLTNLSTFWLDVVMNSFNLSGFFSNDGVRTSSFHLS